MNQGSLNEVGGCTWAGPAHPLRSGAIQSSHYPVTALHAKFLFTEPQWDNLASQGAMSPGGERARPTDVNQQA